MKSAAMTPQCLEMARWRRPNFAANSLDHLAGYNYEKFWTHGKVPRNDN
jgi:hypothetical protein